MNTQVDGNEADTEETETVSFRDEVAAAMAESAAELAAGNEPAPAEGDDTLPAAKGDDTLAAAEGDDTLPAKEGDDTAPAAEGEDTLPAAEGEDTAPAADGEDKAADTGMAAAIKSLNQQERDQFAALPADAQAPVAAFLQRREEDMERGFQKKLTGIKDLSRDYQPISDLMAPHMDQLRTAGATPFTYIKRLTDMDRMASSQPDAYVDHIVNTLKIDKAKLIERLGGSKPAGDNKSSDDDFWSGDQPQQNAAPQPAPQPQTPQVPDNSANMAPSVDQEVVNAVQEFAGAMENGTLKHPHFATVRQDMSLLADVYPNDDLTALYQKACIARQLVSEPAPSLPDKQGDEFEDARKRAAKAQTASTVASSEPTAPTPPNFDDMSSSEMVQYFAEGGR